MEIGMLKIEVVVYWVTTPECVSLTPPMEELKVEDTEENAILRLTIKVMEVVQSLFGEPLEMLQWIVSGILEILQSVVLVYGNKCWSWRTCSWKNTNQCIFWREKLPAEVDKITYCRFGRTAKYSSASLSEFIFQLAKTLPSGHKG